MVSNLALFCLATYLATFQKIGLFFPNHLVTLLATLKTFLSRRRTTVSRTTLNTNTFSIMTLSIKYLYVALCINATENN